MEICVKAVALGLAGVYAGLKLLALVTREKKSIDIGNPYISRSEKRPARRAGLYERIVKPVFDEVLSFFGMIIMLPVCAVLAAALFMDDPGHVLFRQKRIGKDGKFFMMLKFRTMKTTAPRDVPTHLLERSDRYITRVGGMARYNSLDEVCQLWDVFRHRMSLIGPRPALWNQRDLAAEREKYGANDILPGITGLAQINGRDELSTEEKARFDGKYAEVLKAGGWKAFKMDVRCMICTFFKVASHDGVHEGAHETVRECPPETGKKLETA